MVSSGSFVSSNFPYFIMLASAWGEGGGRGEGGGGEGVKIEVEKLILTSLNWSLEMYSMASSQS